MTILLRRLAVAAVLFAVAAPLPAAALGPRDAGWWWRTQSVALVEVPPPPHVPDGGLYVEGAPDGAAAVSALRFVLAPETVARSLTLRVAQEAGGEGAMLLACPAASPWMPASAGSWERRPEARCDGGGVLGSRAEDGTAWSFDLSLLSSGRILDVVLVPGIVDDRPEGANGSVFSIAFDPPGADALAVEATAAEPLPRPPDPPRPPVAEPPPPPGLDAVTPPEPQPEEPLPEAAAPAQDPSVLTPKITETERSVDPPAAVDDGKDARALATLVALLSVGVAGVLSREHGVPLPPGLRPDPDGERIGGIGRFRRPRSAPPPPL